MKEWLLHKPRSRYRVSLGFLQSVHAHVTTHSQSLEREVKELNVTLQTLQSEKQQLTEDDQEMIKQRAKLEFDVKDLEESLENDVNSRVSCFFFFSRHSFHPPIIFL